MSHHKRFLLLIFQTTVISVNIIVDTISMYGIIGEREIPRVKITVKHQMT